MKELCDADDGGACYAVAVELPLPDEAKKAAKYFRKGCELGHARSCGELAGMISRAEYRPGDVDELRELFIGACAQGEPVCCDFVGAPPPPDPEAALAIDLTAGAGSSEDAQRLLLAVAAADKAGAAAISRGLAPTQADCEALFTPEFAPKAAAYYEELAAGPTWLIRSHEGESEVDVVAVSTDDIASWTGDAPRHLPGKFEPISASFRPGFIFYSWTFHEPGHRWGTDADGLVWIEDHWAWFPDTWKAAAE
jgi:hypothetical protein